MAPLTPAGRAIASGSAVIFARSTVVVALIGIVTVDIPLLTVMSLAADLDGGGGRVLMALTLLPSRRSRQATDRRESPSG